MSNSEKNAEKKKIKRSIIKLGSSYAITYPRDFLMSLLNKDLKDDPESLKNLTVDCFKVDSSTILVRKHRDSISEMKKISITIKENYPDSFPIQILENLMISCKKLNVSVVEIDYDDMFYEEILEKVHNYGAISYFPNKIIINISSIYHNLNFSNQVFGMLKNFKIILNLIIDPKENDDDEEVQKKIKTYLDTIGSSYNEGLRILIHRVDNYFLENTDINKIINALGNRVLISSLKSISYSIAALSGYRKTDEITNFIAVLKAYPGILEEEIKVLLDNESSLDINQLRNIKSQIDELNTQYNNLAELKTNTVAESYIKQMINLILVTLTDLFDLSITRWIENYVEY